MAPAKAQVPRAPLSWAKKALVAFLLVLELPFAAFFFPLAAVLVLTGILAPLGMMSFSLATKPFSLAMKLKTQGRLGSGPSDGRVATA